MVLHRMWLVQQCICGFIFALLLFGLMTSGFNAFLLGFNDLVCTVMTTVPVCFQDV